MKSFVYQDTTISFVTAAAQTCLLIEQAPDHERGEWIEQMLRLLPVLYLRTRLLEDAERMMEDEPQRFVTEEDYNYTLFGIRNLLGGTTTPIWMCLWTAGSTPTRSLPTISPRSWQIFIRS